MCSIYSLSSSRDGEVRYIGQTTQPLARRLCQHRNYAKRKQTAVHKWINREQRDGFEICIRSVLENARFHLDEVELIDFLRCEGLRLLNLTEGGEGTRGWHGNKGNKRPDLVERNRFGKGKPNGRSMSEDNKLKLKAALVGIKRPYLAERNRLTRVWLGRKHTEATKKKMSLAGLGRLTSEETKKKLSLSHKALGKKLSVENIAKLRAGHRRYFEQKYPTL